MKDLPVYADELIPLMQALDLGGARVLDLGCGTGGLSRRIAREAAAAHVTGIDAEAAQIARAAEKDAPDVSFLQGRGEALSLKTASMDAAIMMKSLHDVPIPSMDTALAELARVLRPGGRAYICEPAYEGAFNDVLRIFHDEGPERAAALAALGRSLDAGLFLMTDRFDYLRPLAFRDLDDFRARMMDLPWLKTKITPAVEAQVARLWARHQSPDGSADFKSRMLVFVLETPKA